MTELALSKSKANRNICHDVTTAKDLSDYVSSRGIPLMPVVYQVVGFGRGDGRHSDGRRRSVV